MIGKTFVFVLATAAAPAPASPPEPPPPDPGALVLRVNLPSYRLEVWEAGERTRSYPITIGSASHPTPTGGFAIERIEWNPSWTPPESPWARGKSKVPPGPENPMGRVKLQFEGLLYVHGTSRTDQIGGAHSHGCLRMANGDALELARLIALRAGVLDEDAIGALEASPRRTRSVRLPEPVPLLIRYGLAEDSETGPVRLEDPYGWSDRPEEQQVGGIDDPGGPGVAEHAMEAGISLAVRER